MAGSDAFRCPDGIKCDGEQAAVTGQHERFGGGDL